MHDKNALQQLSTSLTQIGQRSIIITEQEPHYFCRLLECKFGKSFARVASKQCAIDVLHKVENDESTDAHCVLVEPKMRTRKMQKSFHLQKLRKSKHTFNLAMIEQTSDLALVNKAHDNNLHCVLLHMEHPQFDRQLDLLKKRFLSTSLVVPTDAAKAICQLDQRLEACKQQHWQQDKCSLLNDTWLVVNLPATKYKETFRIVSTASDDFTPERQAAPGQRHDPPLPQNHQDDDSADSEETEIKRHLAIIDNYIEKMQQKRQTAKNPTKKESSWFWWLPSW